MKKLLLVIITILLLQISTSADEATEAANEAPAVTTSSEAPVFYTAAQQERTVSVFADKDHFGLKDNNGNIIVPAVYQKIIMTGNSGWIIQKNNKYGLMNSEGKYLIEPKFRFADRILGRYIKLGSEHNFGIYNEFGESVIPPEYDSIDLLYGKMFLTYKNFRYGVFDFKGNVLIPNICDDIYMPSRDTMKIKFLGEWYELTEVDADKLAMPEIYTSDTNYDSKIREIFVDTGTLSEYSVLTFSDYLIKVLSSISPAHEETIDDLILAHGVDTVGILKKFTWIPKYPVTFAKKYYAYFRNPFNGPLSDKRNKLKKRG